MLCARSIKPLEGGRWRLRRMREGYVLWDFYQLPISEYTPEEMNEGALFRPWCMTWGA
jgi:hypothetical protein